MMDIENFKHVHTVNVPTEDYQKLLSAYVNTKNIEHIVYQHIVEMAKVLNVPIVKEEFFKLDLTKNPVGCHIHEGINQHGEPWETFTFKYE